MREIIFRGKRLDNGKWVMGFYVHHRNVAHYILDVSYGGYEDIDGGFFVPRWYAVEPSSVGQYIGLKDKNGKRIFEGDIVRFRTRTSTFKPLYVRWYDETAQFLVSLRDGIRSYPMDAAWEYEVIGNIHDNPELLEGGATDG